MVFEFLARIDELHVEPADDFGDDLVHFEQGEMTTDTNVGTTTEL